MREEPARVHVFQVNSGYGIDRARRCLPELVNWAAYCGERSCITRHGRELAYLVPAADIRRLRELETRVRVLEKGCRELPPGRLAVLETEAILEEPHGDEPGEGQGDLTERRQSG